MPFIKSLRAKTLLFALVPMVLVLVVAATIASSAYERVARDVVTQRDTELARVSAARLSEGLSQYTQPLQGIAVEDNVRSMEPARLDSAIERAQSLLHAFDGGVAIYNAEGLALAPRQATDFPVPSKLDQMRGTLRPVYSDVFEDAASGEDVILIGVPIVGDDGEFKGMLAGTCTLKYSLLGATYARVLEFEAGRSGYAYLVDGNRRVIYHRDSAQVGMELDTVPVIQVTEGKIGAVITEDASGETVVSGFAPVPGTGWGVVTRERWDVVMEPIRRYGALILWIMALGSVTSGALVFFSISQVLKPIRNLTRGAERIAGGDFDHTVVVNTGDEIEHLAHQFNAMSVVLKESFAELEKRLAERQRAEADMARASEALRESEEKYRLLVENQTDLIIKVDAEAKFQFVSPSYCALFGKAADELLGNSFMPLVHEDDRESTARAMEDLYRPPHTAYVEQRAMTRDGWRWLGWMDTAVLDESGNVTAIIGVGRDITKRKQAEERAGHLLDQQVTFNQLALALGETRDLDSIYQTIYVHIQALVDAWGFIVSSYDDETQLIRAEYAMHKGVKVDVTGFPPIPLAEPGQGTQSQVIHTGEPLYTPDHRQALEMSRTEYVIEQDGTIRPGPPPEKEDDATRSALYVPMKVEGKTIGLMQLQSPRLDAYTREHIDVLAGMANVAAVAVENARLLDTLQRSNEELQRHREQLEELVAGRTAELNQRITESEQLNRAMANLLEDLQAANHSLETTSARLEEINQELDDFAYVISHDLKAPLRGISQLATWIGDDYANILDEDGKRKLHLLTDRVKRMHALINGVLQYSRIGRSQEQAHPVDLNHLVRDVIGLLAPPAHIRVDIEDELPVIVGEPTRLAQVFQNLVDNGIKFLDKPEGEITIGCIDQGTHWQFSVSDNGPGIEQRHHDRIFRLFQTLAPQATSTGIGLALVKRIVETSGGRVWVESTAGAGSTFYFTLPKREKGERV